MKHFSRLLATAGVALVSACGDSSTPAGPTPTPQLNEGREGGGRNVSIMTRNVYIGFNADAALAALSTGDPNIFVPVLQASIATLMATDFNTRAKAIVGEIALNRPHAVGLQEVYRIHADLNPLGVPVVIDLDYLAILQAEIAKAHLPYVVAANVVDSDLQPLPGIELIDRDVLLVDASRVKVGAGVIARTFEFNIGLLAPGIDKKAGYIVAPVTIAGWPYTLVTTHLESDLGPGSYSQLSRLRAAQASEIARVVGAAPMVLVVGDMNDTPGSLMNQVLAGAGFSDTWMKLHSGQPGFTGDCFSPDLTNRESQCQERIDFVFARGFDQPAGVLLGTEIRVGMSAWERLQGPGGLIWPSDHAGLVGDFRVPPLH